MNVVVHLDDLRKVHGGGESAVAALNGVSLSVAAGTFLAVMGPSGSGKSTLLNCAAGLEQPTSGSVWVDGRRSWPTAGSSAGWTSRTLRPWPSS